MRVALLPRRAIAHGPILALSTACGIFAALACGGDAPTSPGGAGTPGNSGGPAAPPGPAVDIRVSIATDLSAAAQQHIAAVVSPRDSLSASDLGQRAVHVPVQDGTVLVLGLDHAGKPLIAAAVDSASSTTGITLGAATTAVAAVRIALGENPSGATGATLDAAIRGAPDFSALTTAIGAAVEADQTVFEAQQVAPQSGVSVAVLLARVSGEARAASTAASTPVAPVRAPAQRAAWLPGVTGDAASSTGHAITVFDVVPLFTGWQMYVDGAAIPDQVTVVNGSRVAWNITASAPGATSSAPINIDAWAFDWNAFLLGAPPSVNVTVPSGPDGPATRFTLTIKSTSATQASGMTALVTGAVNAILSYDPKPGAPADVESCALSLTQDFVKAQGAAATAAPISESSFETLSKALDAFVGDAGFYVDLAKCGSVAVTNSAVKTALKFGADVVSTAIVSGPAVAEAAAEAGATGGVAAGAAVAIAAAPLPVLAGQVYYFANKTYTVTVCKDAGVIAPCVGKVTVTPATAAVAPDSTQTLTAQVYDTTGHQLTGRTVQWASSDPSIATVAGTGLSAVVTGAKPGSATITATVGGKTGKATVTVTQPPLAITPVNPSVQSLGGDVAAWPSIQFSTQSGTPPYTWSIDNGMAGSIDANTGLYHPQRHMATGVITVRDANGRTGATTVTVTTADLSISAGNIYSATPPPTNYTVTIQNGTVQAGGKNMLRVSMPVGNSTLTLTNNSSGYLYFGMGFFHYYGGFSMSFIGITGIGTGGPSGVLNPGQSQSWTVNRIQIGRP